MSHNEMEGHHVKVMSPYNAQCFAIREALKKEKFVNSNVTTAVSSQGIKHNGSRISDPWLKTYQNK